MNLACTHIRTSQHLVYYFGLWKAGRIFQIQLSDNGTALASDPVELFRSENRYRDVAFGPDGKTIYVITDVSGPVQAMKTGPITPTTDLWSPGSLLVFKYVR
jgi:hypothetical protein